MVYGLLWYSPPIVKCTDKKTKTYFANHIDYHIIIDFSLIRSFVFGNKFSNNVRPVPTVKRRPRGGGILH